MTLPNRRKDARLSIPIPVRVQGHSPAAIPWEEMTKCEDASTGGAAFQLKREVLRGQVVHLSLPLPRRYRRYDAASSSYLVYALVESVQPCASGFRVGASFIGKRPPAGFERNPGALFTPERRSRKRGNILLKVRLQKADHDDAERTVLENYSAGGARVMTGRSFAPGEVLQIEDADGSFRTRAEVRSIYLGKDGIRRLNLRFLG